MTIRNNEFKIRDSKWKNFNLTNAFINENKPKTKKKKTSYYYKMYFNHEWMIKK